MTNQLFEPETCDVSGLVCGDFTLGLMHWITVNLIYMGFTFVSLQTPQISSQFQPHLCVPLAVVPSKLESTRTWDLTEPDFKSYFNIL